MDTIWSFILECNKCDIHKKTTSEYFVPQQKFDHIWAHELLASKNFENYSKPIELTCPTKIEEESPPVEEDKKDQLPYRETGSKILPLDQQLDIIQQNLVIRKKLADDFINRDFPWYIQRPSYYYNFKITKELKLQFKDPFEYKILEDISRYQCQLMIIDVAFDIPLGSLEKWLKFSPYVAIVCVISDKDIYRKIKNYNYAYHPVLKEENPNISWQEELHHSLELGMNKAKELHLLEDIDKPFVFVFSLNRGICVWNEFKILRKF
ncbi:uncharacterized protein ACRADG_002317 [Cochliomyia hominivorax]